MTPWFVMPLHPAAHERAAAADVRTRLEAARCVTLLLRRGVRTERELDLLLSLDEQLVGIAHAVRRLQRHGHD